MCKAVSPRRRRRRRQASTTKPIGLLPCHPAARTRNRIHRLHAAEGEMEGPAGIQRMRILDPLPPYQIMIWRVLAVHARSADGCRGVHAVTSTPPASRDRSPTIDLTSRIGNANWPLWRLAWAVEEAAKSGLFAFPPILDVKIDQQKSEIVLDRDKVASMGMSMQSGGRRSVLDAGRQLRQPLQPGRPQLQGHPADRARGAAHPRSAARHPRSRAPGGELIPLSSIATIRKHAIEPRSLNSLPAAQLRQDLGRRTPAPSIGASRCSKTPPRRSCPRATASTTRASRDSSAKKATSSCPRSAWRSC